MDKMRKVLGHGCEYERSGMILKYSVDAGWQKKKGWDLAALHWDEVMEKLRRACSSRCDPMGVGPLAEVRIDIGCWNVCGARLQLVANHLPARVGVW